MREIDFPDFYGVEPKPETVDELVELGIARYREAYETLEVWDHYIIELETSPLKPQSPPNP